MEIIMKPIGYIHTDYAQEEQTPMQGTPQSEGVLMISSEFLEGAKDFREGDQLEVVFYFHKSHGYELTTFSKGLQCQRGVFSTRSPHRPNGIGVSMVTVTKILENRIYFLGADMLDGTPILDIKPYLDRNGSSCKVH